MNVGKNMQSSREAGDCGRARSPCSKAATGDQQVKCPQWIHEDHVWRKERIHLVMGYVPVFCHLNFPSPCQHNQRAFQWYKEFTCYRPFICLLLYWGRTRGGKLLSKKSSDSAPWWRSKLLCGSLCRLSTTGVNFLSWGYDGTKWHVECW